MITVSGFLDDSPVDVDVELNQGRLVFTTKGLSMSFPFSAEFSHAMQMVREDAFFRIKEVPDIRIPGPEVKRIIDKLKQVFVQETSVSNVAFTAMAMTLSEPFLVFYNRLRINEVPDKIMESACEVFMNGMMAMIMRGQSSENEE